MHGIFGFRASNFEITKKTIIEIGFFCSGASNPEERDLRFATRIESRIRDLLSGYAITSAGDTLIFTDFYLITISLLKHPG